MKKNRRGRFWRSLPLLLIPIAFAAIPFWRWYTGREVAAPEVRPVPVVVTTPLITTLERTVSYSGNLIPDTTTHVVPRISGRVVRVYVTEGDRVVEGQELLLIDDELALLQAGQAKAAWEAAEANYQRAVRGPRREELESARASLAQAERDLEVSQTNLERTQKLHEAGTVTDSAYENAVNAVDSARTQVDNARRSLSILDSGATEEELAAARATAEAARKQWELAELQLRYTQVTAPISGTVASVAVETGNSVGTGQPVVSLINDGVIFATVQVPERLYGEFRRSQSQATARVVPIAYPGTSFGGRLTSISQTINPASRTFEVEVAVSNRDGALRPGMFVEVEFVLNRLTDAMAIPLSALVQRNGSSIVFVADGADSPRASEREVTPGLESGDQVEIVNGLSATDLVIVEGQTFLEEGQQVEILAEDAP